MNDRANREIPLRVSPDSISDASIEKELDAKRKQRAFREEGWFYYVRIGAVCVCAVGAFAVALTFIWHLIAPEKYCWLTPDRIAHIESAASMIIVGVIGTLSASYFLKK